MINMTCTIQTNSKKETRRVVRNAKARGFIVTVESVKGSDSARVTTQLKGYSMSNKSVNCNVK